MNKVEYPPFHISVYMLSSGFITVVLVLCYLTSFILRSKQMLRICYSLTLLLQQPIRCNPIFKLSSAVLPETLSLQDL